MSFLALILRNVFRRPVRSLLTIVGVAVAIGAVVALLGIARSFRSAAAAVYQKRGIDLIVERKGVAQPATSTLDETLQAAIAKVAGVEAVGPVLTDVVAFPDLGLNNVPVHGWPFDSFMYDGLRLVAGRRLESDDRGKALLGITQAKQLGKSAGDKIEIYEEEFEVAGVFESFDVGENGSIVVLLPELQRMIDRHGQVSIFAVRAAGSPNSEAMNALVDAIDALGGGLSAKPTQAYIDGSSQLLMTDGMSRLTSLIAILAGAIGMLNTMIMSVFERTRELGVLRAIGWRRSRVLRMVLTESVCVALTGAAAGALLAIGGVWLLAKIPMLSGLVDPRLPPQAIIQGFVVALFVGLAGGFLPALRAASILPTEALRHE